KLGEGSSTPTNPQHPPTFIQPSSSQPQKTQKPRKPKRKDTLVPQRSGPTDNVTNEAIHKELGDRLVRAATTASSLGAEHDSGDGPRFQETIGDTTTQTRRVKKLEKRNRSRTHKLNRLYKVGLSTRVESFIDEESLGKDADEDIILVNDVDNEMFDVDDLGGKEVFVVELEVDKGKGIMIQDHVKPKKIDQIRLDKETTLKLKAGFDEEETLAREKAEKEQEANITLFETWDVIQAKINVDHQLAERLQLQEFQQLLEKRRNNSLAKRVEEKRNNPPTKAQQGKIMCAYLKNIEGYKLKDFKLKEFDRIQEMFHGEFRRVNTFEYFKPELVERKEKRAGEELEQEITKKQKVEDDK
nr:hypothetical protein [Tanacetum cinerariifolium]